MIACHGRLQREGEVIHVVARELIDFSGLLRSVGEREAAFPLSHGRGDEATHGGGPDPRETRDATKRSASGKPRDIFCPDNPRGQGQEGAIKVSTRNFR